MSGRELDPDGTDSYHPQHKWEQSGHPLYLPPQYRTKANWPPRDAQPAGPHEQAEWESLPGEVERPQLPWFGPSHRVRKSSDSGSERSTP